MTNNTDGAALLPVTQADRDAAADAVKSYRNEKDRNWQYRIRVGLCDGGAMVQAFARHRQSHALPGDVGTALRAEDIKNAVLDMTCANMAPIEWDDADWHQVRRALAALTPSALSGDVGEGGWLPIETAPKDGTRILVAFDERKGNRVDAAHWRRNLRGDGGYFSSHIVESVSGMRHMRENQPIRWQPMPVFATLPSHQGAGE